MRSRRQRKKGKEKETARQRETESTAKEAAIVRKKKTVAHSRARRITVKETYLHSKRDLLSRIKTSRVSLPDPLRPFTSLFPEVPFDFPCTSHAAFSVAARPHQAAGQQADGAWPPTPPSLFTQSGEHGVAHEQDQSVHGG